MTNLPTQLNELADVGEKATQGEWYFEESGSNWPIIRIPFADQGHIYTAQTVKSAYKVRPDSLSMSPAGRREPARLNAQFCVAAANSRNLFRAAAARIEELEGTLREIRSVNHKQSLAARMDMIRGIANKALAPSKEEDA